jgi:multidrug efflux pump subunit AcrA (membrane-fusion protein)
VVALAVLGAALYLRPTYGRAAPAGSAQGLPLRTAVTEQRGFVSTLRLSGTVEAVQSLAITSPMVSGSQIGRLTITKLAKAGRRVHPGDLLVEFDRQDQIKTFLDKQAEYQDLVDQITKKQADEATNRAKDESDLQQAHDQLSKAQLALALTPKRTQLRSTFDLKRAAAAADIQHWKCSATGRTRSCYTRRITNNAWRSTPPSTASWC